MNENSSVNQEKILEVIYKAFDQVNEALPVDKHIEKDPGTILLGAEGAIDSLGLTIKNKPCLDFLKASGMRSNKEEDLFIWEMDQTYPAPEEVVKHVI